MTHRDPPPIVEALRKHDPRRALILLTPDIQTINDYIRRLEANINEVHALLDSDPSQVIRNEQDGYPEGRPDRELSLLDRVSALCRYAADWKRWTQEAETMLSGKPVCRRCGAVLQPGIATGQTWVGHEDFGGDAGADGTTLSPGGPGKLIECLKCPECGHSVTP